MTTRVRVAWTGRTRGGAAAALCALFLLAGSGPAVAGSYLQPDVPRPDSTAGSLTVETIPSGLVILIDEVDAGRSPVGPVWIAPKTVRVRAIPSDPIQFDTVTDAVTATISSGSNTRVFLDMRPSILLRSEPEPSRVYRSTPGTMADTLLGETPLRLRPALLERGSLRLECPDHADSALEGSAILALADGSGGVRVMLRRVARRLSAPPPSRPVLRRRWVQWTMVGVGAGLTVAAAAFKREGDRWYDRYLDSSDRRVLDTYFNRAEHYDRLSLGSLAAGQVLFTGGLVLLANGSHR